MIGVEPGRLVAAMPVDRLSPRTLAGALARARTEHPTITTAAYNVDVAAYQVKIAEGALYPTLTLQGAATKTHGSTTNLTTASDASAPRSPPSFRCRSTRAAANTRRSGRPRRRSASAGSTSTPQRDQVQSTVTQAWGQLQAAKAQIEATQAQVAAAEIALNGVREEARVGQRTTLDVLNAQQDLVNARVSLVTAQRDRVVASYTVLAAVGSLSPQILGAGRRRTTIRWCTISRCATAGSAFARPTDDKSFVAQALPAFSEFDELAFDLPHAILLRPRHRCARDR